MEILQALYDKTLDCIYCEQSFTTKKVRSRFVNVTKYDTDFCPIYSEEENNINALFYKIHVCPHCGFSSSDDYSNSFPPFTKRVIEEKISSQWVPHHFSESRTIDDAIQTYKLAGYCAGLKKEKHIITAGIFIRLAWLLRFKKDKDQEERFLKVARQEYMESYSTEDFIGTKVSEVRILYLIGDISKRISDIQTAVKYFSMVIERKGPAVEKTLVEMARERWQEIRELKNQH